MMEKSNKIKNSLIKTWSKIYEFLGPKIIIDENYKRVYSSLIEFKDGKKHRFHLRILKDGRGILTINAEFILYLNHTAMVFFEKYIETGSVEAVKKFFVTYYRAKPEQVESDFNELLEKIEILLSKEDACPIQNLGFTAKMKSSEVNEFPLRVYLALTYKIDKSGKIGYEMRKDFSEELDIDSMKKIIDRLFDIGVPQITLSGGECTLKKGYMELIEYGQEKGVVMGMITNGVIFSNNKLVKESIEKGLDYVEIVLHSHKPEIHNKIVGSNDFDKTINAIKNFEKDDIYFSIQITLTKNNIDSIEDTIKFLKEDLKVVNFECNALINTPNGIKYKKGIKSEVLKSKLEEITDLADDLGMNFQFSSPISDESLQLTDLGLDITNTHAAKTSITVEPNGDVLAVQLDFNSAGNILKDDWDSIWYSEYFKNYRENKPEIKVNEKDLLTFLGGGNLIN